MKRTKQTEPNWALLDLFSSEAYLVVNKSLLKKYGPDKAIFISNLVDKLRYFLRSGQCSSDGWFFQLHKTQIETLNISEYAIREYKKFFQKEGILKTRNVGCPAKQYYALDLERLVGKISLGQTLIMESGFSY